ncbi:MAG: hypothetical protein Q4A54_10730, partial [Parabacteroides sp.]|nr:hypothetical protein [Parabacteroides sp.]
MWLAACNDKITIEEPPVVTTKWDTARVAVIVPLSGEDSYDMRFKRIAKYFEENAVLAQRHWTDGIHLELEWYD